ncbi:MAG: MazG nucleotide pyrophosphohydrolase domain-containing protein, partial [Bacteroidota bacterium]
LGEYRETIELNLAKERQEEEFGDLLFSLINYARWQGIDPEMALEKTNQKFKRRFEYLEERANGELGKMTLAEMEAIWQEAKEV